MLPRPRLLPLLLLLGCGHSEPFANPDTGTDRPFDPGPPVRITANRGGDLEPAWLADGSGTLYSLSDPAREDRDVCLGMIPTGGTRQSEFWCDVPEGFGRTDAVLAAGPGPDGRLAFLATGTGLKNPLPEKLGVRVAPTMDPNGGVEVLHLPYPRGATLVNWVGRMRWLAGDRLAYLAQHLLVRQNCANFVCAPPETTVTSLGVEALDLAAPTPAALTGTAGATGLATLGEGAEVLYTLAGDSRIFRRNLASGEVTVAHDFGAAGIVRDLDAAGTRVVAVVGGLVGQAADPDLGQIQWDSGGVLHLVDLDDNSDAPFPDGGRLYRRPALSPSGDLVMAEGYQFSVFSVVDPGTGATILDTAVVSSSDLYRFGGP
jgi:hypothetical protein